MTATLYFALALQCCDSIDDSHTESMMPPYSAVTISGHPSLMNRGGAGGGVDCVYNQGVQEA